MIIHLMYTFFTPLHDKLFNFIENWRSDIEQIDDICVVGIEI